MANENLGAAKQAKNDEFYTQYADIEKEMNAYLDYDQDAFKDKTVLLPCDDPEWSNFTRYFAQNFQRFGMKKLISTSYAYDSKHLTAPWQPTLFESDSPHYDKKKSPAKGKIFTLDCDQNGNDKIDINDLQWEYLDGDGDFRSREIQPLLSEADMVVTNPPFSLFREFLSWVINARKQFSVIGNMNAITYKEVFPLIRDNKTWLGPSISSGDREFEVPDSYPLEAAKSRISKDGRRYLNIKGIRWFTNIEHGRRHQPLQLMNMEDNLRYNRKLIKALGGAKEYRQYDNYDGIDVPFTDAIPAGYKGLMGVPISFLDKYNPEQFQIFGITQSWDDPTGLKQVIYPTQVQVSKNGKRSQVKKLNDGAAIQIKEPPSDSTYYEVNEKTFIKPYVRVLIRKNPGEKHEG
ncbi:MAG: adenine-specific methyltransferase EcoRI family protein [Bifidobacterium aquikefiri]|uniref:adenine-specific methyltransferase EcoRI family protein n=1 Tax=Bifidobacterium aquikefiri TaxID=1653207 RepID=UPI0039EB2813